MSNENEKLPRDFDMPTHSPYDDIVEEESYQEKATKAMHMGFPYIPQKKECSCSGYTLLHFGCKCK